MTSFSLPVFSLALIGLVLMPHAVSAHEQHIFEIGTARYEFVVGAVNEPVSVDDKSGVDLRIAKLPASGGINQDAGTPVQGLEDELKVELIAADKKKVQSLSPVYGIPGAYKTTYYPTVATTIQYRVFGELEGTPIDLTFACSPAGHTIAEESKERVQISDNVTRTFKTGSYGCPTEKSSLGFPEESAEMSALAMQSERSTDPRIAYAALVLAFLALAATFVRNRA